MMIWKVMAKKVANDSGGCKKMKKTKTGSFVLMFQQFCGELQVTKKRKQQSTCVTSRENKTSINILIGKKEKRSTFVAWWHAQQH